MIKLSCIVINHQGVMYKRMRMWKGGPNIDFKTEWQNQKPTFIWLRCNPTTGKKQKSKERCSQNAHAYGHRANNGTQQQQ